jgi:hypothetical protein
MTGQPPLPRRTLLRGAGAVLVVTGLAATGLTTAGCDSPGSAQPSDGPTLGSPGGPAVVTWGLVGGDMAEALQVIRPLRLAIYRDGETIADAAYRTTITPADYQDLLNRLVEDLRAPHTVARTDGSGAMATDAATTVFTVLADGAKLEARADGLDEMRYEVKYSSTLYDARDRLGAVYKQVVATAQPYLSQRVRLVTGRSPERGEVKRWPDDVPVPTRSGVQGDARYIDLDGDAARSAVRVFSRDLDHRGAWPVYELANGAKVGAAWRYLLPDE